MESIFKEVKGKYQFEVFYDETSPMDMVDPTIYEDGQLEEYLSKFETGELIYCGVVVKSLCDCCGQAKEEVDSLWGIDAETPEKALDHYICSYAEPQVQDAYGSV